MKRADWAAITFVAVAAVIALGWPRAEGTHMPQRGWKFCHLIDAPTWPDPGS